MFLALVPGTVFFFVFFRGKFLFFMQLKKKPKMSELSEHTFPVLPGLLALPISARVQESSGLPVEGEDSESIFAKKFHPDPTARPC